MENKAIKLDGIEVLPFVLPVESFVFRVERRAEDRQACGKIVAALPALSPYRL
jgi:hypothetical protein